MPSLAPSPKHLRRGSCRPAPRLAQTVAGSGWGGGAGDPHGARVGWEGTERGAWGSLLQVHEVLWACRKPREGTPSSNALQAWGAAWGKSPPEGGLGWAGWPPFIPPLLPRRFPAPAEAHPVPNHLRRRCLPGDRGGPAARSAPWPRPHRARDTLPRSLGAPWLWGWY